MDDLSIITTYESRSVMEGQELGFKEQDYVAILCDNKDKFWIGKLLKDVQSSELNSIHPVNIQWLKRVDDKEGGGEEETSSESMPNTKMAQYIYQTSQVGQTLIPSILCKVKMYTISERNDELRLSSSSVRKIACYVETIMTQNDAGVTMGEASDEEEAEDKKKAKKVLRKERKKERKKRRREKEKAGPSSTNEYHVKDKKMKAKDVHLNIFSDTEEGEGAKINFSSSLSHDGEHVTSHHEEEQDQDRLSLSSTSTPGAGVVVDDTQANVISIARVQSTKPPLEKPLMNSNHITHNIRTESDIRKPSPLKSRWSIIDLEESPSPTSATTSVSDETPAQQKQPSMNLIEENDDSNHISHNIRTDKGIQKPPPSAVEFPKSGWSIIDLEESPSPTSATTSVSDETPAQQKQPSMNLIEENDDSNHISHNIRTDKGIQKPPPSAVEFPKSGWSIIDLEESPSPASATTSVSDETPTQQKQQVQKMINPCLAIKKAIGVLQSSEVLIEMATPTIQKYLFLSMHWDRPYNLLNVAVKQGNISVIKRLLQYAKEMPSNNSAESIPVTKNSNYLLQDMNELGGEYISPSITEAKAFALDQMYELENAYSWISWCQIFGSDWLVWKESPVLPALRRGNFNLAKKLLSVSVKFHKRREDQENFNALLGHSESTASKDSIHYAAASPKDAVLQYLEKQHGHNVIATFQDRLGWTAMHYAAVNAEAHCIRWMVQMMDRMGLPWFECELTNEHESPLSLAVKFNRLENVKCIALARINEQPLLTEDELHVLWNRHRTLDHIFERGHHELLKWILSTTKDFKKPLINGANGPRLFQLAIQRDQLGCIKVVHRQADYNSSIYLHYQHPETKQNSFMCCVAYGNDAVLNELISGQTTKQDIVQLSNEVDVQGNNVFHYAMAYGYIACLHILLDQLPRETYNHLMHQLNVFEQSPLDIAQFKSQDECIALYQKTLQDKVSPSTHGMMTATTSDPDLNNRMWDVVYNGTSVNDFIHLVQQDASVLYIRKSQGKKTLLHILAGRPAHQWTFVNQVLKYIFEHPELDKQRIAQVTRGEKSPMMIAMSNQNLDVCRVLLRELPHMIHSTDEGNRHILFFVAYICYYASGPAFVLDLCKLGQESKDTSFYTQLDLHGFNPVLMFAAIISRQNLSSIFSSQKQLQSLIIVFFILLRNTPVDHILQSTTKCSALGYNIAHYLCSMPNDYKILQHILLKSNLVPEIIQKLINAPDKISGHVPLHHAIMQSSLINIRMLLNFGANVNVIHEPTGMSIVHFAMIESKSTEALVEILRFHPNLNVMDEKLKMTPLTLAIHQSSIEKMKKAGSGRDQEHEENNTTTTTDTVSWGRWYLLNWKGDRIMIDESSSLRLEREFKIFELKSQPRTDAAHLVRLQIHRGTKSIPVVVDMKKCTVYPDVNDALDPSVAEKPESYRLCFRESPAHETVVDILLRQPQLSLNMRINIQGDTALHYAVVTHQYDIVELLLESGSDVNQQNAAHQSPLHYLIGYSSPTVSRHPKAVHTISLLLDHGAQCTAMDDNGISPIQLLFLRNHSNLNTHGLSQPYQFQNLPQDVRDPVVELMAFLRQSGT